MPLRDEIEKIRDRAITALNAAHDYFTYTKDAWRTLQQDVEREGRRFTWVNTSTKSSITEKDVLAHAQRFLEIELASSSLQQFASIFENFFFDVARAWVLAFPARLSTRQISGRVIFRLADKAAIVNALVDKELQDVFYDRPVNWFEYIRSLANTTSPSVTEAEHFAEIKATRDVLVHGQGISNAFYIDKAGSLARAQLGHPLDIPGPYHQRSWELICKLVRDIGTEMAAKA